MTGIDLPLGDDAAMLRDALDHYLARNPAPTWPVLAGELGLAGIGVPEQSGGTGGGGIERALVASLLAAPLAADGWLTHAVAANIVANLAPGHALLSQFADGARRLTLSVDGQIPGEPLYLDQSGEAVRVQGMAAMVAGGMAADWLLLCGEATILLIDLSGGGVERRERPMLDGSMAADIHVGGIFDTGVLLADGDRASEVHVHAGNALLAGRCAELCGLMQRMMADTQAFTTQRKQFGTPIASFQVLRHRLADMEMARMKAAALTELAILGEDGDPAAWSRAVSAACIEAADAARIVGEGAVQLHGAMGLTEELALGGLYKRALAVAAGLGSQTMHLARHAELAEI